MNLKELKELGTPHYFGLGFIQLKIDETRRYHFYHPTIMPILDEEEIHNHRYDFTSTVVKGRLFNEIFDYESDAFSEEGLFEVSCKKEDAGKEPVLIDEVIKRNVVNFSCSSSDHYDMKHFMFHRIRYIEPTITFLERGPILSQYARIIKPKNEPAVCPFSKIMSQEEIWEIIAQILVS